MDNLKYDILCRDKQLNNIGTMFGDESWPLPSSLFLYGLGGTGKTMVMKEICTQFGIKMCWASCLEIYSQRVMFESLLNQMADYSPCKTKNFRPYVTCDSMLEFVDNLKSIANTDIRYCILLEQSERLRDGPVNIFHAFSRLQELCSMRNICVTFMSRIPIDKFRDSNSFLEPITIHFPQYTRNELEKILIAERPISILTEISYNNYVNLVLNIFYMATRNLPELKHLIELNLPLYCQPIVNGDVAQENVRFLWRNIEPRLKKALSTVYLREISSDQFIEMQQMTEDAQPSSVRNLSSHISRLELPFYSKFLLAAAYIASYNPAKTDKRFFMKKHGKSKKTQASIKAKLRINNQLTGPKSFPLDRMMAIFYAIIEDKVAPTAKIFSQISSLVSLGLLTSIGQDDNLDCPKYKCNVSFDNIRYICRTVQFDIIKFLYEFSD